MAVTQDIIANVLCLGYAVTQHHCGGASLHGIDQEQHSQNSMPFPFCQVSRQNGGLTRVFYFSPRFILLHTNFSRVNRALSNLFYIIFFSICCFLKYFAYHQAGFLCNLGRLERCKQESNQAGIQKTGDEVASR